jgi:hypothetical protein
MKKKSAPFIAEIIGEIPNRLQLAGGWIDQPFVSRHNPKPPGAMVVVQIKPDFRPMDRSGIASGTRAVAMKIWNGKLPNVRRKNWRANFTKLKTRAKPSRAVRRT